jgi:hypothetical protein
MEHDPRPARKHPVGFPARSGPIEVVRLIDQQLLCEAVGRWPDEIALRHQRLVGEDRGLRSKHHPGVRIGAELVAGMTILSGHVAVVLLEAVGGGGVIGMMGSTMPTSIGAVIRLNGLPGSAMKPDKTMPSEISA